MVVADKFQALCFVVPPTSTSVVSVVIVTLSFWL